MKINRFRHPPASRPLRIGLVCLVLFAGCAGLKEARLADQLAQERKWEGAIILYEAALKKDLQSKSLNEKLDKAKLEAAKLHHEKAKEDLRKNEPASAIEELKRAVTLDPSNPDYRAALEAALKKNEADRRFKSGQRLLAAEKLGEATQEFENALSLDPDLSAARDALEVARERQRETVTGLEDLDLSKIQPVTLRFDNTPLKDVFTFLSRLSGLNILLDRDVRPIDPVTISVKDTAFKDALLLVLSTNNLFAKKIGENAVLVIPKNEQKFQQYQDLLIRTFYLSHVKAKDMINLLRTMLDAKRMTVNDELNAIVIRDSPAKIRLAEKLIEANDRKVAEVSFDVEVLEVNRTNSLKLGWNLNPAQVTGSPAVPGSSGPIPFKDLRDATVFFTLPSVIVDLLKTESEARVLANPKIRVVNNTPAKMNMGDRVPILLSTTTTSVASSGQVPTSSTATSIEYKDVGVKLAVEPQIHLNNDVTLKINLEVTSLGDLVDLGPQKQFKFGNRTAETTLHVRDGETVVIGGLIRDEDRTTVNKVPGLGDIPILGKLFSNTEKGKVKTDILLTITPHVVGGLDMPLAEYQSFWSGTEGSYSTSPAFPDRPPSPEPDRERPSPGVAPPMIPPPPIPPPP